MKKGASDVTFIMIQRHGYANNIECKRDLTAKSLAGLHTD
jgi:hypothetical protein